MLRAPRWRVARQPHGAFGTVRTRIRCPFTWRFYLEVASRSIAKRNLLRACGVHPERWSRRQTRCAAACSWPGPRRSPPIVPKPPMDSAAPDGRCGQLGDGLGEVDQSVRLSNEPVPELPTATLDKPSAAFGLPTGAWTSRRCSSQHRSRWRAPACPHCPQAPRRPNFLIFREERTGAIQKSTGPAVPLRRRALRDPRPWKASGPCSRSWLAEGERPRDTPAFGAYTHDYRLT